MLSQLGDVLERPGKLLSSKMALSEIYELLGHWIIELPALVTRWIAHKDAFLHVRLQRFSLVSLDIDIGKCTPNTLK